MDSIVYLLSCYTPLEIIKIAHYIFYHTKEKKSTAFAIDFFQQNSMVLVTGLEPVRCCHRGILSLNF
nr:MAG TPA: hypothetical protein [Caudoviricetes sp.]